VAGTFYRHTHEGSGDWDAGLAPLYFGGRHGDSYYHAVLPPLLSMWGDRDSTRVLSLAPLAYYARGKDGWDLGIAPLYFVVRARSCSYDRVPPLFARCAYAAPHTLVAGTFYRRTHEGSGDWDAGLAPLYFGGRHGDSYYHAVLPPLLSVWGDQDSTRVLSLAPL